LRVGGVQVLKLHTPCFEVGPPIEGRLPCVYGLGCRVPHAYTCKCVQGSGFRVQGSRFGVQGSGLRVQG